MLRNAKNRRGQSLIVFMLFLLVLVGVLALTLDFGFVLLSRRMMQAATDTAALEGARDLDGEGRQNAADVIRNVFDDDLDPTANSTTLGAGPDQSLVQRDSNGRARIGSGAGGQAAFANRQTYIYRPNLELNAANADHGDMVRGDYKGSLEGHAEPSFYARDDFEKGVDEDGDGFIDGDAFLVRLRRTPQRMDVANPLDREAGVSSSGSGSPLLLGHLAFFTPSPAGEYDIRRDGATIRATSIAERKPVVHVGTAPVGSGVYSSIEFVNFEGEYYTTNGLLLQDLGDKIAKNQVEPVEPLDVPIGYVAFLRAAPNDEDNYVVVGFRINNPSSIALLSNASSRLSDAWETLRDLDDEERDWVLKENRTLAAADEIDLAPALVRATP
jgi:hypothetical protein